MTNPDTLWQIRVLGSLSATRHNQTLTRFRTRKTAALLAYLAFHRSATPTREQLVDLFWPDATLDAGRDSLSTALSALRRQLEPPGMPKGSVVIADRYHVRLNSDAIATDAAAFERLLRDTPPTLPFPRQLHQLSDAFDLYRGELLPGFADDWIEPQRQRLREEYMRLLGRLLGLLYDDTRYNEAVTVAQRAVKIAPEQEAAHYHLLDALRRVGDAALFQQHMASYRQQLADTLGSEPSERIRALTPPPQTPSSSDRSQPPLPMDQGEIFILILTDRLTAPANDVTIWQQTDTQLGLAFGRATDAVTWLANHLLQATARVAIGVGERTADGTFTHDTLTRMDRLLLATHSGQVLATGAAASLLECDALRSVRLGTFRLSAGVPPQVLYAIEAADAPSMPFPPMRLLPGLQNNLPPYLTRYIGREDARRRLHSMLESNRLVTITGMGGIGKTRFAVESLRPYTERESVIFVPMADVAYVEFIADMVLEHLPGVDVTAGRSHDAIVNLLDQHAALLILDSFEHLADGGGLYLERLLGQAEQLRIVVTSRRRLNVPGEVEIPLGALPTPLNADDIAALSQSPAVALFIDRAQRARPDFQLTDHNAADVRDLCARLEGIPLALELAAARAGVFTPAQMLDQLTERFAFLVDRRPSRDGRHQALFAALNWSYELLTKPQRAALRSLAVFRASWDATAAEAICEIDQPADILHDLRGHSLLWAFEAAGVMRFQMFDTVRAFAWELVTETECARLLARHTAYYCSLAGRDLSLDQREAEMDNFRAVMWRTLEGDPATYLTVASSMLPLWRGRAAYLREGRHWLEQGLRYLEETGAHVPDAVYNAAVAALHTLAAVPSIRRDM